MTRDGVDGTGADRQYEVRRGTRPHDPMFIRDDDGRLGQRYIEPRYFHAPAGASPNSVRRERQVASALRNCTDFVIARLAYDAAGKPGRHPAEARLR